MTTSAPVRQRSTAILWVLRILGAALLLAIAGIHFYLWQDGYRDLEIIGPSFLLQVVVAVGGALLVLIAPRRLLPVAAVLGALFALGSLGALILATTVGLFGFDESTKAPLWWETLWVEIAAIVVLGALTALSAPRRRSP
jgi:hypothetical protein